MKNIFELFDLETDPVLRRQILTYHISDLLTDVERARLLGLPKGCRIRERAKILAKEKLKIGNNVWIGEGAVLDAQGGLEIGENTQIGLNVMIWSHTSHSQALQGKTGNSEKEGIKYSTTRIGKNCFIGGPSVIAPGVTLGDGVIVSPLTFVDRNADHGEIVSSHRELKQLRKRIDRLEGFLSDYRNQ